MKKFAFFISLLLLKSSLLFAASEETLHGTLFSGVWYPSVGTVENLDASFKAVSSEELGKIAKGGLNKHPRIKQALELLFPEEIQGQKAKTKLATLVISRATDTLFEYTVKDTRLYQHFFNITASFIVVNPLTGQVEYSRVLTGELPVLENKQISLDDKKGYFLDAVERTLESLLKKTELEFENNPVEGAIYNFQVRNFTIKDDAKTLGSFQNDLNQFLHDSLVLAASKKKLKIYFLPPKSQWEAKTWEQFKNKFDISASEERPMDRADALLKEGRLLTVGGVLSKLAKLMVKGNEIDAYYLYTSYTAGAVVERGQNGEKVAIRPKNIEKDKQVIQGNGSIEYHDIQGMKATASSLSLYFDATQEALRGLSDPLINNCKLAFEEKSKEF